MQAALGRHRVSGSPAAHGGRLSRACRGRAPVRVHAGGKLPLEVEAPLPWGVDREQWFLDNYWQKRPLLVRGAIPNFQSYVSPDELAGLACEGDAPARIIVHNSAASGRPEWELRTGPFAVADFSALPPEGWTLLVNGVDRLVPQAADVLDLFDFVPRWRIDDVQVSYAPRAGGVGPHSDQYDVFLLQANGAKRWAISDDPAYAPDNDDAFIPGIDVAVLHSFTPQHVMEVRPGDMLYLPPRVAHHGVALEKGLTWSIGFLAPARKELWLSYADAAAAAVKATDRWSDPDLPLQKSVGELSPAALDAAAAMIASLPRDRAAIGAWFGTHITMPRGGPEPEPLEAAPTWEWVVSQIEDAGVLLRHEASRFAFVAAKTLGVPAKRGGCSLLFVDGRKIELRGKLATALARAIADRRALPARLLFGKLALPARAPGGKGEAGAEEREAAELLLSLVHDGLLYIPADDDEDEEEEDAAGGADETGGSRTDAAAGARQEEEEESAEYVQVIDLAAEPSHGGEEDGEEGETAAGGKPRKGREGSAEAEGAPGGREKKKRAGKR